MHCPYTGQALPLFLLPRDMTDPFALAEDGTARDPEGFQAALRADPAKLALVMEEPEDRRSVLLGDDTVAFQALLKAAVKVIYHCATLRVMSECGACLSYASLFRRLAHVTCIHCSCLGALRAYTDVNLSSAAA